MGRPDGARNTVEAIAEAAQTNKMTLYRYFDSKEARADVSG